MLDTTGKVGKLSKGQEDVNRGPLFTQEEEAEKQADAEKQTSLVDAAAAETEKAQSGAEVQAAKAPVGVSVAKDDPRRLEPSLDRSLSASHLFGNANDAEAIRVQGFHSLDRKRQGVVLGHVIAAINQEKVFRAVVQAVPVDVMNGLVGAEGTAEDLLHNKAVLAHRLSVPSDKAVLMAVSRFVDAVAAASGVRATAATEDAPLGSSSRPIDLLRHGLPTSTTRATDVDHSSIVPATDASPGQKDAGNYQKQHAVWNGLEISIENAAGTRRRPEWPVLKSAYGYLKGTTGKDKENLDVFIKTGQPLAADGPVYVINQYVNGRFDEHKIMLGWTDDKEAQAAYLENYTKGWKGLKSRGVFPTVDAFKEWLKTGDHTKPAPVQKPADASTPAVPRRADNPFRGKAERARALAERLSTPSAHEQGMANAFPLGAGFGRPGAAKRIDASLNKASKWVEADKNAKYFEAQADAFDEGKINAQGRRNNPATAAKREKAAEDRDDKAERTKKAQGESEGKEAWQVTKAVYAESARVFGGNARKLLDSEHAEKVADAVREGKPVPAEVLADYPHLAPEPKSLPLAGPRESLIQRIVTASRDPIPPVVEVFELKGTDGNWHGAGGMPSGVEMAKPMERRSVGFAYEMRDGTRGGTRGKTREEMVARAEKHRDDKAADLEKALRESSDEKLQSQAEYWLKNEPGFKPVTLESHEEFVERLRAGEVALPEYKARFRRTVEAIPALTRRFEAMPKTALVKAIGGYARASDPKARLVSMAESSLLMDFAIGRGVSYSMTGPDSQKNALAKMVEATTQADLDTFKEKISERRAERSAKIKGIVEPKTIEDFENALRFRKTKALTPEEQRTYDELLADKTRAGQDARKDARAQVQAVGQTVTGAEIVETVHTRDKYPLFVVKLGERVPREAYASLLGSAKKMGGWYSAFKGNGAVPGFQFKDKAQAEAFKALATEGDTAKATEAARARLETRTEEKQDNAVTRLREMAERVEARGEESLNADRQTNTARRAAMASGAEGAARKEIALAKTMRNLAAAIDAGNARHLAGIRHKTQVEMLNQMVRSAQYDEARKTHPNSYMDQEKMHDQPPTVATIDVVKFPEYRMPGRDIMSLADNVSNEPGFKLLAARMKKAGNYSDDIITLPPDLGAAFAEKTARLPPRYRDYRIDGAFDKRRKLAAMGIENEAQLRSALREFIKYRGEAQKADAVKELERSFIGQKLGVDFFPTPKTLSERMVEMAGIADGMRVLEPSGGNGNIAESIRDAGAEPDVVEISSSLRKILEAKKFNLVGNDFTEFVPEEKYDRVVMNPPFSNGQDGEHVQRAYDMLKPGGKLVAIVGEGSFFRNDAKAKAFRSWLESVGGQSEALPEGTFSDKSLMATTGANARLVTITRPGDSEPKYSAKPKAAPFYSPLERAASALKQPMKGADALRFLSTREGVKAAEIKWTGLDDFLRGKGEARVTPDEVRGFLKANAVTVTEVQKGDQGYRYAVQPAGEDADGNQLFGVYRFVSDSPAAELEDKPVSTHRTFEEAEEAEAILEPSKPAGGPTKFHGSATTLPGGQNYREVLLTLPVKRTAGDLSEHFDESKDPNFRSSHFDEPNILAHVRFNERTDANGKRVLFLEEIQSDWAQQGRREGFKGPDGEMPAGYTLVDENEAARASGLDVRADAPQWWSYKGPGMSSRMFKTREEAIADARRDSRVGKGPEIPRAPFVEKTEDWTALALKSVLHYAAANGFDSVAWTPGSVQADRYDLSQQVDAIGWHKHDGTDDIFDVWTVKDGEESDAFGGGGLKPAKIAEYVGKDIADKIVTDSQTKRTGEYRGADLRVGGEGMKAFYDKIVPQVAEKIGKKFGARVGKTALSYPGGTDVGGQPLRKLEDSERTREGLSVHSLPITPEMRAGASEGFPLFKADDGSTGPKVDLAAVKREFPRAEVRELGPGVFEVKDGLRTVHVRVDDEGLAGTVDREAFRAAYGRDFDPAKEQVAGAWVQTSRGGVMWLAKAADSNVLRHERFHYEKGKAPGTESFPARLARAFGFGSRIALTDAERAALYKKFEPQAKMDQERRSAGSWDRLSATEREKVVEEYQAEAYAHWRPEEKANSLFSKILETARRFWRAFRPSWESAFERVSRGDTSEGRGLSAAESQVRFSKVNDGVKKFSPRGSAGAVTVVIRDQDGRSSGTGEIGITPNGLLLIDGTTFRPTDEVFFWDGKFYKDPPTGLVDETRNEIDPFVENMKRLSAQIDRTVAAGSPTDVARAKELERRAKEADDPWLMLLDVPETSDVVKASGWERKRYPWIRDGYSGDLRDAQEIDAISATHDPKAIEDYFLKKMMPRYQFSFLHVDGPQNEAQKKALRLYRANGGSLGKTALDALGDGDGSPQDGPRYSVAARVDTPATARADADKPSKPLDTGRPLRTGPMDADELTRRVIAASNGTGTPLGTPIEQLAPPEFHRNFSVVLKSGVPKDEAERFARIYAAFDKENNVARGKMSWDQGDKEALKLLGLHTREQFMDALKRGVTFNEPGLRAATRIMHEVREEHESAMATLNAAREARGGKIDSDEYRAVAATSANLAAWTLALRGEQAEAARAFNARKDLRAGRTDSEKLLGRIFKNIGGLTDKQAEAILRTAELEPEKLPDAIRRAMKPGFWDYVNEWRKGGLLWSPRTFLGVNPFGNALKQAITLLEIPVGAAIDRARGGADSERQVRAGELAAAMAGLADYGPAALKQLRGDVWKAMKGVEDFDVNKSRPFEHQVGVIPGSLGKLIRTPFRFLQAADDFFKETAKAQSLYREAFRRARNEGLTGQNATRRAEELIGIGKGSDWQDKRVAGMIDKANRMAMYETFTLPTNYENAGIFGSLASAVQQVERRRGISGAVGLFAPFKSTPAHIAYQSFERSPFGLFLVYNRIKELDSLRKSLDTAKGMQKEDILKDIEAKTQEMVEQMARAVIGSALFGVAASMAALGLLTGSGPADWEDRKVWMDAGNIPTGVKVGDSDWYAYDRFEPAAASIAIAANFPDILKERSFGGQAAAFMNAMQDAWVSKTYLQGLEQFGDVITDPKRYGEKWLRDLVGSFVPAAVAQTAEVMDPTVREKTGSLLDGFRSRVPGLSDDLPASRTGTGEPAKRTGRLGGGSPLNPLGFIRTGSSEGDPLAKEFLDADYSPTPPRKTIVIGVGPKGYKKRHEVDLLPAELEAFRKADARVTQRLRRLIETDRWQGLDPYVKKQTIQRVYDAAANAVRELVLPRAARRLKQQLAGRSV